jgi:hypothetical protein
LCTIGIKKNWTTSGDRDNVIDRDWLTGQIQRLARLLVLLGQCYD